MREKVAGERFDGWSPLVPKTNQIIQLEIGDHTFELPVKGRATSDGITFRIAVEDPFSERSTMVLEITPNATGRAAYGKRPYWQIVSQIPGANPIPAKIFFMD